MKRLIICFLVLFLSSCALLDDFFTSAQIQQKEESESILLACQNPGNTL
ncbi:MAG: hypothetical protein J5787_04130 [Alphaproteobacteria bacterium]|nr:hypothetical protein [Alphaproteobacteria bacterium]MBO4644100.1 hypothetical protein [Alphaproteobacteria bacterium]